MVCGVLYGYFGLLLHKHGCYFQNFILFQIEILLYNIIMQNTLDQLAVGTCYKSVCYSFARKYMGFLARCLLQIAITYVFSYAWKKMGPLY